MDNTRKLILHWSGQSAIKASDTRAALEALNVLPQPEDWLRFLQKTCLWLGMLALAFSAMFFVAYNWDAMGRFGRFLLLEALILACVLVYWKLDADSLPAKLSLLAAGILVGVLLALYGQVYQTGADSWQLFASWALLIVPWVLVSRFAAMWLLLILLINTAMVLYFASTQRFLGFIVTTSDSFLWPVFIFNTLCWLLWEMKVSRYSWLQQRWPVQLLATASGTALTTLMVVAIFVKSDDYLSVWLTYPVFVALVYYFYRVRRIDLYMMAALSLSLIVTVSSLFIRLVFNGADEIGAFYFMTFVLIAMAGGAAAWLKKLHREQRAHDRAGSAADRESIDHG